MISHSSDLRRSMFVKRTGSSARITDFDALGQVFRTVPSSSNNNSPQNLLVDRLIQNIVGKKS